MFENHAASGSSLPLKVCASIAALALVLAGCSSEKSPTGSSSGSGGGESSAAAPADGPRVEKVASADTTCSTDFRIETIDNGSGPRYPMQLNVEVGEVSDSHLDAEINKTSDVLDYNDTFNLIGDVEATVNKINGDAVTLSSGWKTLTITGIPGGDEAAQDYVGKRSDVQVTKGMRALAKSGEIAGEMSTVTTDQIVAASSRYLTPFPEGDVGSGAKWQVWVADDTGTGSKLCTASTYTLDSFDGKNYAVTGSSTLTMPPGTVGGNPDFGTGAVVSTTTTTSATGDQTLKASGSLDNFYPDAQQIEANMVTTVDAVITAGGSETTSYENITQHSKATYSRP